MDRLMSCFGPPAAFSLPVPSHPTFDLTAPNLLIFQSSRALGPGISSKASAGVCAVAIPTER